MSKKSPYPHMKSEEYMQAQAAFDHGNQSSDKIFSVARQWGVEAAVNDISGYNHLSREEYISMRFVHHVEKWRDAGIPKAFTQILTGHVADIGCGIASGLELLPSMTALACVDPAMDQYADRVPDKAALGVIRSKVLYKQGLAGDVQGRYDSVYSFNAIDHGVDWEGDIMNCARILKPGGDFLLGVHVCDKPRLGFHRRLTHPSHFSIERLNSCLWHNGLVKRWQNPIPDPRPVAWLSLTWVTKEQK